MSEEDQRSIEIEIEVPGTPEQVWQAIATGPGISSWYVPHTVEERQGGAATASFGAAPEMQIEATVTAWEPPRRIAFGKEGGGGLAFEWLIEARQGGTCIVRLVNSGFGTGEEWDDHYDGMAEGWRLFLLNLRLHLEHFAGRHATAMLPMAMWSGPREQTWATLTGDLGLPAAPEVGARVVVSDPEAPPLAGVVADVAPWRLSLVLDQPVEGTAFLAAEGSGAGVGVSIWAYLYGPEGAEVVARDEPRWAAWLNRRAMTPS